MIVLFFIISFILLMLFISFNVNFILAFILTFILLLLLNMAIGSIISRRETRILDEECDPEKYITRVYKRLKVEENRKKQRGRLIQCLYINLTAGYVALGDYMMAKQLIEQVDPKFLSKVDGSYLVYIINYICCYYGIGCMEEAERRYETEMVVLNAYNRRLRTSVQMLVGERFFYQEKYEESYQVLNNIDKTLLDKRQYLSIVFLLGKMDLIFGDKEKALKKLNKVKKMGNKLHITTLSKQIVDELEMKLETR